MQLETYSIGIGDRFAQQGTAQLQAVKDMLDQGIGVAPVWNKSNREHEITGTSPQSVRQEAEAAVCALDWTYPYYVDADHVALKNVDPFIQSSNYFTLDVADAVGRVPEEEDLDEFFRKHRKYCGELSLPGADRQIEITEDRLSQTARKYLCAVREAGKTYRHIADQKGAENFVTEVSMDETEKPQEPEELFIILAALADEGIPAQTIAPKFTGAFNKGIDYIGDVSRFRAEFRTNIQVITRAIEDFSLPENLKMSVHSGSDKFSIYTPIHEEIVNSRAGLHLKTAGTTWLEEVIGLACGTEDAVALVKDIYAEAYHRFQEVTRPYAPVVNIEKSRLPDPQDVAKWSGRNIAAALRHIPDESYYNPHFRQLFHVAFKLAAEKADTYVHALQENQQIVAENVRYNLCERHLKPVFAGK